MRVWVLMADGVWDSSLAAVCDVLAAANALRGEVPQAPTEWSVTVVGTRRQMHTAAGLRVTTVPIASADAADVVVVPALGLRSPAQLIEDTRSKVLRPSVAAIAAAGGLGAEVVGACSGTLLMAQAGILDGQPATTSWWLGPLFREYFPTVELDVAETLVFGRGVRTAGAAFAHIDLALSLVHQRSPVLADLVARYLLIGDRASQAGFAMPAVMARHNPELSAFERWVRAHLDQPIRIGVAAASIGVSERTLQRITDSSLGMSPLEFVNDVRLDEAVHLLRSTGLSVEAVAARVGFANATALRRLVQRRLGKSPLAVRQGAFR
ncbi:GlxA family transcriptional regulator [Sporichthya polymorpha]|uniref:GlxA family transcriptional regulator n=1 Tax=Sporichthya polymorpha TaxID=35751 RepID=UPI0005255F8D|nr:helix-turn-helix domain-containing protein [Sporichthya polymorpha]